MNKTFLTVLMILTSLTLGATTAMADNFRYNTETAKSAWLVLAKVEQNNSIPRGLLHSISLVETGKGVSGKIMPWPYTINVNHGSTKTFYTNAMAKHHIQKMADAGFKKFNVTQQGNTRTNLSASAALALAETHKSGKLEIQPRGFSHRFQTSDDAVSATKTLIRAGHNNVDVGLMQINWKYHGEHFTNLQEAFDPEHNVGYAVSYLKKHKETRDWWGSVGRYHSGTKKHADKYIQNVWNMYKRLHKLETQHASATRVASL